MGDKRKDYISWDEYFMGIVTLSGMRSKDPNTQVGGVYSKPDTRYCPWDITDCQEAVQMMSFHGTEMVKIISISIQLIVSLMHS